MNLRERIARAYRRMAERRGYRRLVRHPPLRHILGIDTGTTGADYTDYWALYSYIKKRRPQQVLEFGPGVTTLIMAQALFENGAGQLTSMEDVPHYYEGAKRSIPSHLHPIIDLRLSSKVEKRFGPFVGVGYEHIPERPYDFIFVDGPHYDKRTEYDADILEIIAKSETPITAIIDYRLASCFIYHLALGNKFKYSYLRKLGYIDGATKHSLRDYERIVVEAFKSRCFKRV